MVTSFNPRLVGAAWAIYAWATMAAYVDTIPDQLVGVHHLLPTSLWFAWCFAAVLLTIGVVLPLERGARWCRVIGLAAVMALLVLWTAAFLLTEGDRGWVSARQYIMLCAGALFSASMMGMSQKHSLLPKRGDADADRMD